MKKISLRDIVPYIKSHKKRSIIIGIVLCISIIAGVFLLGGKKAEAKYILALAEKGSIIVSVTGSGQVSASNQVDLKPKVSGDVVYVGVKVGDEVKSGSLIARIDDKDAQKLVRDAEINLETAQLSYNKLIESADATDITVAENALLKAEDDLKQIRNSSINSLSGIFTEIPNTISDLHDLMFDSDVGSFGIENITAYKNMISINLNQAESVMTEAKNAYDSAETTYLSALNDFNNSSVNLANDDTKLTSILDETYNAASAFADTVRKTSDLIKLVKDDFSRREISIPKFMNDDLIALSSYLSSLNTEMLSLMSIKNNLRNAIVAVPVKQKALDDLKKGPDDLDLRSAKLSLDQKKNNLSDAKEKLANYYIRAPFDGTIAKLNIKNADSVSSDSVSSGSSIATLVTKQKLAEISLNEVDASKVNVDNKATITFDAISDLTISGKVVEMDTIGTVSQGVVTYNVKIAFDTQDDRVKSGMSLSVSIMTDIKQDVLTAPSSAVKSQGDSYYVEVVNGIDKNTTLDVKGMTIPSSLKVAVEVGLSNDDLTEITSGIAEGDILIARTISASSTTKSTTSQSSSLLGSSGAGRQTGDAMMIPR